MPEIKDPVPLVPWKVRFDEENLHHLTAGDGPNERFLCGRIVDEAHTKVIAGVPKMVHLLKSFVAQDRSMEDMRRSAEQVLLDAGYAPVKNPGSWSEPKEAYVLPPRPFDPENDKLDSAVQALMDGVLGSPSVEVLTRLNEVNRMKRVNS